MRSLSFKLTLAFLAVGVLGIIIFAVIVGVRARVDFNRFLSQRDQQELVNALGDLYARTGSWEQVDELLARRPQLDFYREVGVLADASGVILMGGPGYEAGSVISDPDQERAIPIVAGQITAGFLVFPQHPEQFTRPARGPENDLVRRSLWSAAIAAAITALVALAVGGLWARTLTRPVAELTAATRAMAGGNLHQQVVVRSRDEIGELASSFNHMSSDLAHATQLRKQMTADLAHDLRTPLSILRGYAEGLREGRLSATPDLYALMHDEVLHLQRLVEDLRTLSLADAGELPLNRRTVDPSALLERTGLAYFMPAEERGLTLRVETEESLPSVTVDTDRMTQVLNNLVSNAMRHTNVGEIVLAARRDGESVVLEVSDTGDGISPEDVPFVFDRFYRGDKARRRSDDGSSGLGLAIAKAIIEAHGGTIAVFSTQGAGTTMRVSLPARITPQS